jgi:polar amino acid transport system substrate-binding protein
VNKFSRYGADVVLITAATRSAEPLKLATQIVRDRGRIVVVGDVLVEASRAVMYEKELTLLMSRSYGPGRYDPQYEESGCDYPIAYVRWTEQRNMEAFLDLLAADALDLSLLFEKPYALRDIESAYSAIRSSSVYTAIVEYPAASGQGDTPQPTALRVAARSRPPGDLRIGCIGAGSFARSIAFPALRAIPGVGLESVAASTGVSAESARRNYQFARTQTATELLSDGNVDVVLVLSRHDSHADYVSQALENRKPVYVEKPLAINRSQLLKVREACNKQLGSGVAPFVMVGFNRRFAPATRQIRDFFVPRCEPMAIHIRVNAGSLPPNHWTTLESQGGRVVGELCHFIDWARAVVTAPIRSVRAVGLHNGLRSQDDVAVILSFWDGSVANLLYLTNGDASVPKEYFEVFCEGAVAQLDDFHLLRLHRAGKARKVRCAHDKGHRTEFLETIQAIRDGQDAPIPFEQIVEVTEASLAILESIRSNSEIVLPLLAEDSSEMGRVTAAEERWRTQKG